MGDGHDHAPHPKVPPPPAAPHHNHKASDPKHSRGGGGGGGRSSSSSSDSDDDQKRRHSDPRHAVAKGVAVFLLVLGLIALIVWLIYRPEHPQFSITNPAIYTLNATALPLLAASFQFTILIRNPNQRVSIHYQRLNAYVSYRNTQITQTLTLPPLHQVTRSLVSASPVLGTGSDAMPVSPELLNGLAVDESYGVLTLRVVVTGRMRWKAGAIKTARKTMNARCDLMVGYRGGVSGPVPLLSTPRCRVDI